MENEKNWFLRLCENSKILVMMACSIVGVGFVSGTEIFEFYVRFQEYFVVGVVAFFLILFALSKKVLNEFCYEEKMFKMQKSIKIMSKNTILIKSQIKSFLIKFNCLMVSGAMFSGLNVLLKKIFFNNYYLVVVLSIFAITIIVAVGVEGLKKLDYFVFLFVMFLTFYFLKELCGETGSQVAVIFEGFDLKTCGLSMFFAGLYVFMNIIQIHPVLCELNAEFSRRQTWIFAGIFSIILTAVLLIFCFFLKGNSQLFESEMPFLEYFSSLQNIVKIIFELGLIFALLTSLVGSLFSVKKIVQKKVENRFCSSLIATMLAFVLSLLGFRFFVSVVYPLIGVVNFVIFMFL